MQNNLKFRAFDTKTNQWIETGFHILGEIMCFQLIEQWLRENTENPEGGFDILERLNDVEESQWTGLKDKNNKEVYFGDIVRIQIDDNPEDLQWELNKVIYSNGAFRLESATSYEELLQDWITLDGQCDFEVIGNIYENKELLNT